ETEGQQQEQAQLREQLRFFEREEGKEKKSVIGGGMLLMVVFCVVEEWIGGISLGGGVIVYWVV
ncbi:hypothetical protein, partial [Bacillus subtilis]|uniref:hypothetical protein n=1 Tax=Bacillus subtilis TaxID=1423 RepID=UPI001BDBA38E